MVDPKIMELFSYSQDEQSAFPYLQDYMTRIRPKLPLILEDPDTLERFMLAGLFLTYRAFNHWGESMTTDDNGLVDYGNSIHIVRIKTFKQVTGKDIISTGHYRRWISFGPLMIISWFIFGGGKALYHFVIHKGLFYAPILPKS